MVNFVWIAAVVGSSLARMVEAIVEHSDALLKQQQQRRGPSDKWLYMNGVGAAPLCK